MGRKRTRLARMVPLLVGVLTAACGLDGTHPDRCGAEGACPLGRTCYDGYCVRGHQVPEADAGMTMWPGVTDQPDAGVDEPPPSVLPPDPQVPPGMPQEDAGGPIQAPGGPCGDGQECSEEPIATCESDANCKPACREPGTACTLACAEASNCDARCEASTTCNVLCQEASNCELACEGSCILGCDQASNCRAKCKRGSLCDITCPASGNCDELECVDGAACILRCETPEKCGFKKCDGQELACSATVRACNRGCP